MDIASELDRLLPTALEESSAVKVEDDLFRFLNGLAKAEYESALTLLPERPIFQSLPSTPQTLGYSDTGLTQTTVREVFTDSIAYTAIKGYVAHVPPIEIIFHLFKRLRRKPGNGLRRLARMMSRPTREGLFQDVIELDLQDAQSYDIVAEFTDYLESLFKADRPGMVDAALEKLLAQHAQQRTAPKYSVGDHLEEYILRRIQQARRNGPYWRDVKVATTADVRYVVEEARRELFVYAAADKPKAVDLLWRVLDWYDASKLFESIAGRVEFLTEGSFFDQLRNMARYVRLGSRYEELWHYYIDGWLTDEVFWHNLAGLNGDVSFGTTEAARRQSAYRRSAVIGPAILMTATILAPILLTIVVRTGGTAIRLFRWVQGSLLFATQHVYSTYRFFGAIAGTGKLARDVYVYYLTNAVAANQQITTGTEVVLDLAGSGTGMSPGSSPADMTAATAQKLAKVAEQSISDLALQAKTTGQAEAEIEFAEFVVKGADGKSQKVTAAVIDGEGSRIRTKVTDVTTAVEDFGESEKALKLYSRPKSDPAAVETATPAAGRSSSGADVVDTEARGLGTSPPTVKPPNDAEETGIVTVAARGKGKDADKGTKQAPPGDEAAAEATRGKGAPEGDSRAVDSRGLKAGTAAEKASSGVWTQHGKLKVNQGSYRLKKPWLKGQHTGQDYEEGFNAIAPQMARDVSKKPVRVDVPRTSGYTTASSAVTNRLKFQKTRRGDMFYRTPDATMEVVEKAPAGGTAVAEAHFWEATTQTAFKPQVAEAGHKQRQITGTLWISTEIERKGYTADTRLYYHFVAPEEPADDTITFLNGIMDDIPNLEITWFVVP